MAFVGESSMLEPIVAKNPTGKRAMGIYAATCRSKVGAGVESKLAVWPALSVGKTTKVLGSLGAVVTSQQTQF
jgi:hypothetical protein